MRSSPRPASSSRRRRSCAREGLLKNIDVLLRDETGLPVMVADDPISAVVLGSGKTLDHIELLKEVTIG